jgi:NADH dehydrogenase [ubiquinone] 1 alpha subcomplex assembly factor 7
VSTPASPRLDVFMGRANAAYYAQHDPFQDFTTAPEIGQVFGELLGAWAAVAWQQMGAPAPVHLVEAGPGRGTLMQDALRALARVSPDFVAACQVHFIETSPRLRAQQAARVPHAQWHAALADVPAGPAIVLANEFLDALPIRQFQRTQDGWAERHVAHGAFTLVSAPLPAALAAPECAVGSILEYGEAARAWVAAVAARLARQGGAALILDYGSARSGPGDSLQALRHGRPADPLAEPGHADLTAHVDFQALAETARQAGAAPWGPLPQGELLQRLGLALRTERLARANPARAAALHEAAHRLAAPARMGALFKALAITQSTPPPGF